MRNSDSTSRRSRETLDLPVPSRTDSRGNFDDPRWHLAQRIAVSRSIGRSPLLSDFLLYVCDRHIRDKASDLTEQRIGVQVFGRSEGYNSNDDNIVRNYARTLRKRVDEYFATEGQHEDLKLEIPRGAYIPVFYPRSQEEKPRQEEPRTFTVPSIDNSIASEIQPSPFVTEDLSQPEAPPAQMPPVIESQPTQSADRLPQYFYPAIALCMLLIGAVAAYLYVHGLLFRGHDANSHAELSSDVLWNQLFQKDRDTFIVPADSGLVIMQGLTQLPVSLGDYASGTYHTETPSAGGLPAEEIKDLGTRRYTSIVDLNLVSHLSRLKQIVPERMMIRYARDLRMDDLRAGNAILLGSVDSNPWVELFQQQLNFRFSFSPKKDTAPIILNQHPLAGEQPVYANHANGTWHNTFGTIAYLPNLDGTGHVLLIAGLNMAGTQAAGDFVLNPALMQPTLDHAKAPNGTIRPFEILIETNNVAANASRPHVVSERIAPL